MSSLSHFSNGSLELLLCVLYCIFHYYYMYEWMWLVGICTCCIYIFSFFLSLFWFPQVLTNLSVKQTNPNINGIIFIIILVVAKIIKVQKTQLVLALIRVNYVLLWKEKRKHDIFGGMHLNQYFLFIGLWQNVIIMIVYVFFIEYVVILKNKSPHFVSDERLFSMWRSAV